MLMGEGTLTCFYLTCFKHAAAHSKNHLDRAVFSYAPISQRPPAISTFEIRCSRACTEVSPCSASRSPALR